jgi:Polyketide cyclase / dehydrase and lipid transport
MLEMASEADIRCSAENIFDLIADFQGQDRWLTNSSAFRGTNDISSNPVTLGTSYREPGPFGVRNGSVTEFERPTKITFHQPMTLKLRAGTMDVTVRYTLSPGTGSTHVKRVVSLGLPWQLKVLQPIFVREFRVESARTVRALKAYADKLPRERPVSG